MKEKAGRIIIENVENRTFSESRWFRILGAISVVIALPAAIVSLPPIQEKVFDRGPKIEIDLASEISVLDIRNPLRGLSISLSGRDLNASREALVASRVIIRNKGKVGIKSNDLSTNDPLGFSISGGELIQITRFTANTRHLQQYAQPLRSGNNVYVSTNILVDPNDSLNFDLLIKKPRNSDITYRALGKISNVKSIEIIDLRKSGSKKSFIEETFFGNLLVQLARLASYFFGGLLILAGVLFTADSISTFFEKRRQRKNKSIIDSFILNNVGRNKTCDAVAASIYDTKGIDFLEKTLIELKKIPVSASMGKISGARIKIIGEQISPNLNSISQFFSKRPNRLSRWLPRIEEEFNLVNADRTEVQQAYITSIEAMIDVAKTLDPQSKFSIQPSRYNEIEMMAYRYALATDESDERIAFQRRRPRSPESQR